MKRSLLSPAALALLVLLVFPAVPARATDFASHHLLVPIAGRTAGAFGSQWKTDLVVTNAARNGEPLTAEIYFLVGGNLSQPVVTLLGPRQSTVIEDVIHTAFGHEAASGIIVIAVREPHAKLTARARIYNTGSGAGDFGQTVQAMPYTKLSKEAFLTGLPGLNGNRTNVGIANPGSLPADFSISLYDQQGEFRGSLSTRVAPFSVRQFNDVFSEFQAGPLDGATIQIRSSHGVYTYASIIRAASGDVDFVMGTATELDESDAIIAPQCTNPSTLSLAALPAEGWTVLFKPGVNPHTATPVLELRHGFNADRIYEFGGFHAWQLTPELVAELRCEGSVRVIEQNGFVPAF
jgi:hypothetical protein